MSAMEFKTPTSSVIARLMGLDELPPPQPLQKKPRVLSGDYFDRITRITVTEKRWQWHSLWSSSKEEEEDNDFFRVLEMIKRGKNSRRSLGTTECGRYNDSVAKVKVENVAKNSSLAIASEILPSSVGKGKDYFGIRNRYTCTYRDRSRSRFAEELDLTKLRSIMNFNVFRSPCTGERLESVNTVSKNLDSNKSRKTAFAPRYELENGKLAADSSSNQFSDSSDWSCSLSSVTQGMVAMPDTDTWVSDSCPSKSKEQKVESNNCMFSVLVDQEVLNGTSENESIRSGFSSSDPESFMSMEENFQPSPHSVLDPMSKKEGSSFSDCFGTSLYGLPTELEYSKLDSLGMNSEDSEIMVSSDEDIRDGSISDSGETEGMMSLFRVEESRDFSYLVDLLTEAGLNDGNLSSGLDKWHSLEQPISYTLFETLEKKYGDQISWKRSERRLLYDCINSGLVQVLQQSLSVPAWAKPVAKRVSVSQDQDLIEEELWLLLVNQENEAKKDMERILDFGDDVQVICREIEQSLVDELVAEVIVGSQDF